ncbi:MAG TPA: hypothetical protein VF038_14115 [Usitatibacter sp.]
MQSIVASVGRRGLTPVNRAIIADRTDVPAERQAGPPRNKDR